MSNGSDIKPTDLRGILRYVPQFREKTFVIAADGAVVGDENFGNILLELGKLSEADRNAALARVRGRRRRAGRRRRHHRHLPAVSRPRRGVLAR